MGRNSLTNQATRRNDPFDRFLKRKTCAPVANQSVKVAQISRKRTLPTRFPGHRAHLTVEDDLMLLHSLSLYSSRTADYHTHDHL